MQIDTRPEAAEDEAFLRRLYFALRESEFAPLGLPAAQITVLLNQQFRAQRQQYRAEYGDAEFSVIVCDGSPVGRLVLLRQLDAFRLVDIAISPDRAGQGIGGTILDRVSSEADGKGVPVTLHVAPHNPARRLYVRKGFVEGEMEGADIRMERPPRTGQGPAVS